MSEADREEALSKLESNKWLTRRTQFSESLALSLELEEEWKGWFIWSEFIAFAWNTNALCNCLCSYSSPSSRDFASVVRNIGKFGAKTILQTTEQLIQFTVLEIHFRSLKYTTLIRIRKNLSNIPFLSKR